MPIFQLYESGQWYDTVRARSMEDALKIAVEGVDAVNYDPFDTTTWIEVKVRDDCNNTTSSWVSLDPEEPACSAEEHDWAQIKLQAHGGGAVVTDRCKHCGCLRVTDTWAHNPVNGEQGLTSVTYPEGQENE